MRRLLFNLITIICILTVPLVTMADQSDGTQSESNEINIELAPSDILFNVDNMKPGDWAPRTIIVKNAGIMDFSYQMSMENRGNEELFNELLLEILDSNGELYNGKLSEFTNLEIRDLSASTEEELEFTVRFPEHLGNEFQGSDSQFAFLFTAEDSGEAGTSEKDEESVGSTIGGSNSDSGGGSVLPDTATSMFNTLLIGSILLVIGITLSVLTRLRKGMEKK